MKAIVPPKKNRRGENMIGKPKQGGRVKGTPNKRTLELVEQARIDAENAAAEVDAAASKKAGGGPAAIRKKLGKDVLEDYVGAFHQIAASFQSRIATAIGSGTEPKAEDLAAFKDWGGMVVKTAEALAGFQSPKLKAIMVAMEPAAPAAGRTIEGNVVPIGDATAMARVYQRLVKGSQ